MTLWIRSLVPIVLWATLLTAQDTNWVRIIDIAVEPGPASQDEYTVRLTPNRTQRYDELQFECVYHQEFPWVDVRGRKYQKILEPVSFLFRRSNIELVNDLDAYVSFRVPMGQEVLRKKYGEHVFNPDYPITVSRLKIRGIVEAKPLWVIELPPTGKHVVAEVLRRQAAEREKELQRKEDLTDLFPPSNTHVRPSKTRK